MLAMLTFAAVTAHAGIPYDPPTMPIDNRMARVALSAGKAGEVQWLAPGAEVDENAGAAPYEAIIVEFKK